MKTSLIEYRERIVSNLIELLWSQWNSIGLTGAKSIKNKFNVDPEALIAFSLNICRFEPRLFDEIINWMDNNGSLINIQRLRNILNNEKFKSVEIIQPIAKILSQRQKYNKWKNLFSEFNNENNELKSVFRKKSGEVYPKFGEMDSTFKKYGYYRGKILFRNLSMGIPAKNREALIFKIRMLFGVNARAEIINYLMLMNDSHPTELSRNIYFYQKTVQDVLVDMHYSGLILMNKKGREKKYYIDKQHWYDFFNYNNQQEYWINWVKIYKAFEILVTFLSDYEIKQSNEVSQEFEIRRTMKKFNGYIGISDLKVSLLDYNKTNYNPIDYLIKQSNKVYSELINS